MKWLRFFAQQLAALIVAIVLMAAADHLLAGYFANPPSSETHKLSAPELYFPTFKYVGAEQALTEYLPSRPTLFGSSELTNPGDDMPYRFFPKYLNSPLPAFGHAGNQSLAILLNLLAHQEHLTENSRPIFIISPSWFTATGIEAGALFEFVKPDTLVPIYYSAPAFTREAIHRSLSRLGSQINGLTIEKALYAMPESLAQSMRPLIEFIAVRGPNWIREHSELYHQLHNKTEVVEFEPYVKADNTIQWDDELSNAKLHIQLGSNNNPYGIRNSSWSTDLHDSIPRAINPLDPQQTELKDLKALVEFIKYKKAKALFVMIPLNRSIYTHPELFDPLETQVNEIMKANQMNYLDLARADLYQKEMIDDTMHPSYYGWTWINREIKQRLDSAQ